MREGNGIITRSMCQLEGGATEYIRLSNFVGVQNLSLHSGHH